MGQLAITGGQPLRTAPFPAWPVFDEREVEAVTSVVQSGKWFRFAYATGVELHEPTSGPQSKAVEFAHTFAAYHGARYGVCTANGTGSIEMLFKAIGLAPGDEVIVPAYTYVASATAVLHAQAVPVFVDIEPDTYLMDMDRVEAAITSRTRAIEPVHFGGQPVDMDRLLAIGQKYNLAIIEDAAHAHGTEWRGQKVGALGTAGSFSFQNAKNMTSGEGGIVITNDLAIAELCESYLWSGRMKGRPWYEFHRLGWNYRITEFQAALLLVQLSRLEAQNARRMENGRYLAELLSEIDGLQPARWDERTTKHSFHIFMLRYDPERFDGVPRARFLEALAAEGIPCFTGYTFPLYANPMFTNKEFLGHGVPPSAIYRDIDFGAYAEKCPVTERACYQESIWLEHRLLLGTRQDMDDIAAGFRKVKANLAELKAAEPA
jgi:dTDP-4-amino-4,6-dideoxygalactose transaminase